MNNKHFNEYTAKRQYATEQHDHRRFHVPLLVGNWSRHGIHTTRIVRLTGQVTTEHRTDKCQWQNDKHADAGDGDLNTSVVNGTNECPARTHHDCEGNGARCMIVDSDEVDNKRRATDECRQEKCADNHLLDPVLTAKSCVHTATSVTVHRVTLQRTRISPLTKVSRACSTCLCACTRAHSLCVQLADNCKQSYNECHGGYLVASTDARREQQRVCRWAEDVAVHLFPPVFIA